MRIAIIGRTEILYETAELLFRTGYEIALIITSKETPEYIKTSDDFRLLSKQFECPFFHTADIKSILNEIVSVGTIDIAISLNYSGIIPKLITDLFPLGILNAHGGDLPRYRGNACQAWAILNGEERVGLCIHRMIGDELDSGDILMREFFPLNIDTKVTEIYGWMSDRIPVLFLETIRRLEKEPNYILETQSLDPKKALRCYPRLPEDGRINWSSSSVEILRLINASNRPYGGAYCEFDGRRMTIWDAELVTDEENFLAVPGQITAIQESFIEVASGEGKLRLKEIEIDGNVLNPSSIIRSIRKRLK